MSVIIQVEIKRANAPKALSAVSGPENYAQQMLASVIVTIIVSLTCQMAVENFWMPHHD